MQIVLFEPEIPQNTGNIARLCAATNIALHLIEPLGYKLEDKYLKRAGLDYWQYVNLTVWKNFADYEASLKNVDGFTKTRLVCTSSKAGTFLQNFTFSEHDALIFGPETRGLTPEFMQKIEHRVRVPIVEDVRSLNLATCAGIVLYTALINTRMINDLRA